MLGIVGEYIWRIYDEVKRKPNYVVREAFGVDTAAVDKTTVQH
jgi:dolichol-phosphate mannosyltransferase